MTITIPPEALEAAARAMAKAGYGFAGIELTDPYTADSDYWDHIAHAAIRAALTAWPGMGPIRTDQPIGDWCDKLPAIILPLPKEPEA